jgi:hypothetical protein
MAVMLPTDSVELGKLSSFIHAAWEMGQVNARKLDAIRDLLNAGDEAAALVAMKDFFHIEPAPLPMPKSRRKRHWDLRPLSATGTRKFTAGWLVRLPQWPWKVNKTRVVCRREPGCSLMHRPETRKRRKNTPLRIPEPVAFSVYQRYLTQPD